jgi:glycosyltransferase involved in cell wall biosynthesis
MAYQNESRREPGMKILITTPNLRFPGGVTNYYSLVGVDSVPGVDYFNVHFNTFTHHESKVGKIFRLLYKYFEFIIKLPRYDVVHVNPSLDMNSFLRDAVFIFLGKFFGKKVIFFMHGWQDLFAERVKNSVLLRAIFRNSYARVNGVILSGTIFRDKLIGLGMKEDVPFFLETMTADSRYIEQLNLEKKYRKMKDTVKLGFVSRIEKEKGVYIAIDAFEQLQQMTKKKLKLYIAGDGQELGDAMTYVKKNNIKNVEFPGYIKDERKHCVLSDIHICFFPTYFGEGIPSTILEGMLYGMPIVSRINAGIPDQVEEGVNGFLLESKNAQDFVPILYDLVTHPEKIEEIGQRNYLKAREKYTSENIRMRLLNIYREVYEAQIS